MNQFRQPINNRYNPRMSRYDMQNAGIAPVSCPLPGNSGNPAICGACRAPLFARLCLLEHAGVFSKKFCGV